jgi:N-acetylmuramic acid 6-phosphate etherase
MDHLTTEARNPASMNLDQLSPAELAALMNREDHVAVSAVGTQISVIAECIDVIADRLRNGGRLIYVGAGTSGRLGVLDATECPPTFNTPPELVVGLIAGGPAALTRAVEGAEDHPEEGEKDLRTIGFNERDILVGIATSGRTPYVIGAAKFAKSVGATVIGLVCNRDSELHPHVDHMICPVVGPEILSGSTRLKAGTATKLVLNTLTTGAMVRLGKTYGNLMVDLRATNNKLKARTNRIVRMVTGVDETAARDLLAKADGELKTALVMQTAGIDASAARQALQASGGRVGPALENCRKSTVDSARESLVIGIDGGGTRTVALLADGASILGRGEAGPSNLQAIGVAAALDSLNQAIDKAFAAAGLTRCQVGAICLGLAGADRGPEKKLLQEWVKQQRIANWCEVTSDGSLLLAAGTKEGWGIAAIAGTGSIAVGRTRDGRWTRSGGWGYLLGDEGSGYAVAMQALNAVTRAADGRGGQTPLLEQLLRAMHLDQPQDMIAAVYRGSWDRTALAGLAPIVFAVAESGDEIALQIVERQAGELAHIIAAAAKNLRLNEFRLAVAGGTLLNSEFYRGKVLAALSDYRLKIVNVELVHEPANGAIRLARERLHWTV